MRWIPRGASILFLILAGSAISSACLTPEFDLARGDSDTRDNQGGSGSEQAHCENRQADKDETDTDCGGIDCPPCPSGSSCKIDGDCQDGECNGELCQPATCGDGERNAAESDIDCGGGCQPCAAGKRCEQAEDCASKNCESGGCLEATCEDRISNGNETGVDCGGSECEPCEPGSPCVVTDDCLQPPQEDPASTTCTENICTLACTTGLADCNHLAADGCEINTNTSLDHCGACGQTCAPTNAEAGKCIGGECLIDFENGGCTGTFEDCNGLPEDGCEANTHTDPQHCGECNSLCSDANGTPSCSAGSCGITCNENFEDCDDDAKSNGCEVDTASNVLHCGACENVCTPTTGQTASCDISQTSPCQSVDCTADSHCGGVQPCGACDDSTCDDVLTDIDNCGGCGIRCAAANGTASCNDQGSNIYQCEVASCVDSGGADWEDCDGSYENGCESNVNVDVKNCGGCAGSGGQDCAALQADTNLHIASITCGTGTCTITGCTGDYLDCDGNPNNGCEIDTSSTPTHCGGCQQADPNPVKGVNCMDEWDNASGVCVDSKCEFDECDTGWGNCGIGVLTDGCETDVTSAQDNCGSCGTVCVDDNGYTESNTCTSGACVAICNSSGAQCDGDHVNGCENTETDPLNCGGCGDDDDDFICGGPGQANVDTDATTCSGGTCQTICLSGCTDEFDRCTVGTGTELNCLSCGDSCDTGAGEECRASGCELNGSGCLSRFNDYFNTAMSNFGGTNRCSGSPCSTANVCTLNSTCIYDVNGGSATPGGFTCQGGSPSNASTCNVDASDGGTFHPTGNMDCQSHADCTIDASNGGTFGGLVSQASTTIVMDCSDGGSCDDTLIAGSNAIGIIDCEDGGDCDGINCEGVICAVKASRAATLPRCTSGGRCLCLTGTASDCADICGGSDAAPCGNNASAESLISGCGF